MVECSHVYSTTIRPAMSNWVYSDGGRGQYFKGKAGDCAASGKNPRTSLLCDQISGPWFALIA